jgi:hypothetical protein
MKHPRFGSVKVTIAPPLRFDPVTNLDPRIMYTKTSKAVLGAIAEI